MLWRVKRLGKQGPHHSIGPIRVILAVFVGDDPFLDLQLRLIERGHEMRHAIGFHGQHELGMRRRNVHEVIGSIGGRRTVNGGAQRLQMLEKISRVMLRAFEHQVLEEMRIAALGPFFVLGTDVIP